MFMQLSNSFKLIWSDDDLLETRKYGKLEKRLIFFLFCIDFYSQKVFYRQILQLSTQVAVQQIFLMSERRVSYFQHESDFRQLWRLDCRLLFFFPRKKGVPKFVFQILESLKKKLPRFATNFLRYKWDGPNQILKNF